MLLIVYSVKVLASQSKLKRQMQNRQLRGPRAVSSVSPKQANDVLWIA
jgi:hypothetical protein